ncbi:hypothetical protein [Lysinibacillus sp. K60]|uniref:hypothetical protein n=1 Tax=Lysinibacillus sp. K60 TaxID=2720027 RepID=UPI001C8CA20B|nr:hypothetical protein [Lysinibacillus sp. K60]MBX8945916.1 hypothetical protein [Lysinibacillus sp. K60]
MTFQTKHSNWMKGVKFLDISGVENPIDHSECIILNEFPKNNLLIKGIQGKGMSYYSNLKLKLDKTLMIQ